MARRRAVVPRKLLICCEGKTEEAYFNIILDVWRLPQYVDVEVFGREGQHFSLIDHTVTKREKACEEDDLTIDDVECWAVCDWDGMSCTFTELNKYAENHCVNLAFSDPQFEAFLIQHFEQSGEANVHKIIRSLSKYRVEFGGEGDYTDSTKSDLKWLAKAIDLKPKIIDMAITNSDLRNRTPHKPFLTVQKLVRRIKEMSI